MIYFVRDSRNFIKIGYSKDPLSRFAALRTANPVIKLLLICEGTRSQEAALHNALANTRIRGEWFKNSKRLRLIMEACRSEGVETAIHLCSFDNPSEPPKPQRLAIPPTIVVAEAQACLSRMTVRQAERAMIVRGFNRRHVKQAIHYAKRSER